MAAVVTTALALASVNGYAEPGAEPAAPPPAAAEPETAADAQQQLAELNHELEVVTEQYNDTQILLDERKAEAAVATAQLTQVQRDIVELDGQVRQVAHSAYTGDQLAGFTVLMTSGSPQEFLDKLNTLDAISAHSNGLVTELGRAQQHAQDLSAQADRALAEADAAAADLAAKRETIETNLPVVEALLATLTEQERQAAAALAHAQSTAVAEESAEEPERGEEPERANRSEREPSSPIVAPTEAAQIAVDTAYAQLGDPYVWAADGPDAFDCSGLTMAAWAAAGVSIPHASSMQPSAGTPVSPSALMPGDLVFFYSPISHVALYIGNGQVVHAPYPGSSVEVVPLSSMPITMAVRIG